MNIWYTVDVTQIFCRFGTIHTNFYPIYFEYSEEAVQKIIVTDFLDYLLILMIVTVRIVKKPLMARTFHKKKQVSNSPVLRF